MIAVELILAIAALFASAAAGIWKDHALQFLAVAGVLCNVVWILRLAF